jgi:nitroimidazol reductase NimA-like FMN-containing flavoprotein (pyridoxamine 5'-phosphate oxidase superfamily)
MTTKSDPDAVARILIDSNMYMALGTADETGRPWVSPVYYAADRYTDFYWVSGPDTTHSRNLATRADVSIVIFDSQAPIGTGQAVYMLASAEEVTSAELQHGIDVFSRRSKAHGERKWTLDDVRQPAFHRLYRATAAQHWVLDPTVHPGDHRIPVSP